VNSIVTIQRLAIIIAPFYVDFIDAGYNFSFKTTRRICALLHGLLKVIKPFSPQFEKFSWLFNPEQILQVPNRIRYLIY